MFAFATDRRDQLQGKPLWAKLGASSAQSLKDRAMNTKGARIETLSKLLLAVARRHAADEGQARALAHMAFERLLAKDPELAHFWQVVGVLRDEVEAGAQEAAGFTAKPPRAACVVA